MKKQHFIIHVLLGILLGGFVSCSESDPFVDIIKSKRFEVSTESITLESGQKSGEFTVISNNIDWDVYSSASWIHINGYHTGYYSRSVKFTVDDNDSNDDRSGNIEVYTYDPVYTKYYIHIKQELPMTVRMSTTNYKAEGDYWPLKVTAGSSKSWTIKRNYSDSWVHLGNSYSSSTTYEGNGTKDVNIYVDENTGSSSRSATLTVTCGSTTKTITITQDVAFNVVMSTTNYKAEGDWWYLDVTAGSSQNWTITRSHSWVHLNSSSNTSSAYYGSGTQSVRIYVEENTGSSSRRATLTVTCGSATKTITITQDAGSSGVTINVSSTGTYRWTQSSDGTWTSGNYHISNSTSTMTVTIKHQKGDKLSFKWTVSCESSTSYWYDYLICKLGTDILLKKDGVNSGTYTHTFTSSGTSTMTFQYVKDGTGNYNNDCATIKFIQ